MSRLLQELKPENLLSWPVVVVTTIWAVLIHFFDLGLDADHVVVLRLGILIALQALMFAVLAVGSIPLRHAQRSWAPVALIAVIVVAATVRGAALDVGLVHFNVSADSQLAYRASASAGNLTYALVFATIAVGEVRRHRAVLTRLLADRQVLTEATARAKEQIRIVDAELVVAIQDELTTVIAPMNNGDGDAALGALRTAIEDVARPISHDLQAQSRLWMPAQLPVPDVRLDWGSALRGAFRVDEIRPVATAAFGLFIYLPQAINYLGLPAAVITAVGLFAVTTVVIALGRAIGRRVEPHLPTSLQQVLFFATLLGIAVVLGASTIPLFALTDRPRAYVVMAPVFVALMQIVLALARAAQERAASVELELELIDADLRWSLVRAREAERQRKHALAFVLHGRVQAALSAAYIRVGALAALGDVDSSALSEMRRDVDAAIEALSAQMADPAPFAEIVDKTRATWQDIAEITFHADDYVRAHVAKDPIARSTLNDLIPELCFNAIKHGVASRIDISLHMFDERTLRLTVTNDGGPLREDDAGAGLGNELLERGTLRWYRRTRAGMTETDALIPVL